MPVLSGDAELDGEPVAGGQLLDVLVGGAQGGEPDLLGELGEGRVGEERHVTKQLVAHVWLRSVVGARVVPDVLGGVEDPEGEACQEVPGGEEAGHGAQGEPGDAAEEVGDGLQLGDLPISLLNHHHLYQLASLPLHSNHLTSCSIQQVLNI